MMYYDFETYVLIGTMFDILPRYDSEGLKQYILGCVDKSINISKLDFFIIF